MGSAAQAPFPARNEMGSGRGQVKRVSIDHFGYDPKIYNTPEKILTFYLHNNHSAININAFIDYLNETGISEEKVSTYYLGIDKDVFTQEEINYALNEMLRDVIDCLKFPDDLNYSNCRVSKIPEEDLKEALKKLVIDFNIRAWSEKSQDLDINLYYPTDNEMKLWTTMRINCDYNSYDIEYINGKILKNKLSNSDSYSLTPYSIIWMLLNGDEPEEEMEFPVF